MKRKSSPRSPQKKPQADVAQVHAYILATKSHTPTSADDPDQALFLDMDMSILGVAREQYLAYAHDIREEYIHVPRAVYLSKRAEVLTTFLQQARIYASAAYAETLERRARENVQAEIALLQHGVIPGEE